MRNITLNTKYCFKKSFGICLYILPIIPFKEMIKTSCMYSTRLDPIIGYHPLPNMDRHTYLPTTYYLTRRFRGT